MRTNSRTATWPGSPLRGGAPLGRKARRIWCVAALLGVAVAGSRPAANPPALAGVENSAANEAQQPEPGTPVVPKKNADGEVGDRHIVKLIPDQKVLLGSPPTVLDLADVFQGAPIFIEGVPLELSILRNSKPKVAEATLEGSLLTLRWGKIGTAEVVIRAVNPETSELLDNKLLVEVWEPDYWKLAFTVIGGLGIFLLGMKSMSEGLQAIAGNELRRLISLVTDNRLLATGVGTLVTILIQSSSITTVMVVGFVNSGFMTLQQAIGVIMGANIGTTITGWILALKIGKYGLPILGLGAFGYLFSRRDRLRYASMAFMGLGMVFLGLELMKDGFAVIKDLPEFEAQFARFNAGTYFGVLKCAMLGCALTLIVQSSSATLGITIGLAQIGVIPFETAAALVMGENVGTTITAWLASFGATTNAKRAAYFHVLFNLIGVAWITAVFRMYIPLVEWLVGTLWGTDPDTGSIEITKAIATTHTCFNVVNTLLFLPFVAVFARLLARIVPEKAHKETPHLTSLDVRMLETPMIAIEQSRNELLRMGSGCNKMMDWLKTITAGEIIDEDLVRKTLHREEVLDKIQDEIISFVSHMLAGNIPLSVIDEGRRQLRMADEYESVSDYIVTILKSHRKLRRSGLRFSETQQADLTRLHDEIAAYLQLITTGYEHRQPDIMTQVHTRGDAIVRTVKELRKRFVAQMSIERIEPQLSIAFSTQLNAYRRVRDHALNIAEALSGEK